MSSWGDNGWTNAGSHLDGPPETAVGGPTATASTVSNLSDAWPGDTEDDRVLVAAFAEMASDASQIESTAIALDRAGDVEQAMACYKQAADYLAQAAAACPESNPDRAVLSRRAGQVLGRIVYLESLNGAQAVALVEEHIGDLRMSGSPSRSSSSRAGVKVAPTWRQQAASAAAIGGATGLLVLHAPLVAAGLAVGAAYATTREDGAGQAARSVGTLGFEAAGRARAIADQHGIPEKLEGALGKVRAVDDRYKITDTAQAAASSSWTTLRELERKHKVAAKLGQGMATASAGVASATSAAASWVSGVVASRR